MIDFLSLTQKTVGYETLVKDKNANKLSHAYLVVVKDERYMKEYLKIFATVIACEEKSPCFACRTCSLVKNGIHPDVLHYPKEKDSVTASEAVEIVEQTHVKPLEGEKKIFVIENAQKMNVASQNKLLKTLEEPPKNTYFILGTTNETLILPTVKSRTKILNVSSLDKEALFDSLKADFGDLEKLKSAIACSDGTVNGVIENYNDEKLKEQTEFITDLLVNMQSSKEVLKFTERYNQLQAEPLKFLSVLEIVVRDLLCYINGNEQLVKNVDVFNKVKVAEGFTNGAIIEILEKIFLSQRRIDAQNKPDMVIEWLFFQILEVKYKWRKL